jgi:ABC-2 type transport system ATP-binding protein
MEDKKTFEQSIMELAEIVGIQDALFKPIKKLSGGMQRKLEIIRSLIHTPRILFLDEPTQGLDAMSRRALWEYINDVRKHNGTTVFLTTHYIDEAEHVDEVCIINGGRIAISGTPEAMKASLLKQELILDAPDREKLIREIAGMGLTPRVDDHVVVPCQDLPAQEIIARLETHLTMLRMPEPSLEDAYVEYLKRTEAAAA